MKKTMVRIVAALLVAMLALTLIPMGAFAATIEIGAEGYNSKKPTVGDYYENWFPISFSDTKTNPSSVTVKTSDYDHIGLLQFEDGSLYDLKGFLDFDALFAANNDDALLKYKSSITVKNDEYDYAVLAYALHSHRLSNWYSDGTTHWRECLTCKKYHVSGRDKFMYQNWCQDGDEDGICNVCGGDVPYHDITVIDSEGGKITLNRDNASHRTKITADVEVEAGYKLKKLHFVKVRDDGSKQEITRYKKNGQFWTLMPTYEMEVSAEFVKTGK